MENIPRELDAEQGEGEKVQSTGGGVSEATETHKPLLA